MSYLVDEQVARQYLNQWWPKFRTTFGVTRPQWVNRRPCAWWDIDKATDLVNIRGKHGHLWLDNIIVLERKYFMHSILLAHTVRKPLLTSLMTWMKTKSCHNANLGVTGGITSYRYDIHVSYCQTSNISRTLVGNKIVDHSDVVEASPVGAASTTSSFST